MASLIASGVASADVKEVPAPDVATAAAFRCPDSLSETASSAGGGGSRIAGGRRG